jgi:hypothetical protein
MTPTLDKATRIRCLQDLGIVVPNDFLAIQRAPIAEAEKLLIALKTKVKHNFHRLCLELHPDVNGGDQAKTERFKSLAIIKAEVDKIGVHERPTQVLQPTPVAAPFRPGGPFRSTGVPFQSPFVQQHRMPNGQVVTVVPMGVTFKVPF